MKTKIFKNFIKYKSFVKAGLMTMLAYKGSFFAWVLTNLLNTILISFLWYAIYNQDNPNIYQYNEFGERMLNNFTLPQMITYLLITLVTTQLIFGSSSSFDNVSEDIKEGNIAMQLIKPINYRIRLLSNSFGSMLGTFFIIVIPISTIEIVTLGSIFGFGKLFFSFNWYNILFGFISAIISLIIYDTLDFIIAQLTFFTGASFGLYLLKASIIEFLSGSLIPLAFFPSWAQSFINFLPFAGIISIPNLILMGNFTLIHALKNILLQIIWMIIMILIAKFTFSKSCKHVISIGG